MILLICYNDGMVKPISAGGIRFGRRGLGSGLPRGRGAGSNRSGRFEALIREADDLAFADNPPPPTAVETTLQVEDSRTALTWNDSPDIGFDRSVNPYQGCEHGCIYCYARPTHAYHGLSAGIDFETRIFAKAAAPVLLSEEFARRGYACAPVALGANTDPYQPFEQKLRLTRSILECLKDHRHPVSIVTKSARILRDLDLLGELASMRLVRVLVSITTLDHRLANRMEPRASTPARRLEAVAKLQEAGVPVVVMMAPVIPGLTDVELERVVAASADAGAVAARYVLLRLPGEVAELFEEWLHTHVPGAARRILALVRDTREGALYQSEFGVRQKGTGPYAELIRTRFATALRRHGLDAKEPPLDTSQFRPRPAQGELSFT